MHNPYELLDPLQIRQLLDSSYLKTFAELENDFTVLNNKPANMAKSTKDTLADEKCTSSIKWDCSKDLAKVLFEILSPNPLELIRSLNWRSLEAIWKVLWPNLEIWVPFISEPENMSMVMFVLKLENCKLQASYNGSRTE